MRRAALGVVCIGLPVAAAIYVYAAEDGHADALAAITNARDYDYNLERIGGKAAVYAAKANAWLAALWHGRELAYTVATLTVVVAVVLLWIGRVLSGEEQ